MKGWKANAPTHREGVITWDRCLLDVARRTRDDTCCRFTLHKAQGEGRRKRGVITHYNGYHVMWRKWSKQSKMGNVIEIGSRRGRKLISSGDFIGIVLLTMFSKGPLWRMEREAHELNMNWYAICSMSWKCVMIRGSVLYVLIQNILVNHSANTLTPTWVQWIRMQQGVIRGKISWDILWWQSQTYIVLFES